MYGSGTETQRCGRCTGRWRVGRERQRGGVYVSSSVESVKTGGGRPSDVARATHADARLVSVAREVARVTREDGVVDDLVMIIWSEDSARERGLVRRPELVDVEGVRVDVDVGEYLAAGQGWSLTGAFISHVRVVY